MAYCKNCGTKLDDGAKFCPECGAEIKDNGTKFCAKCGNERKGTEKFCSQCGTPFGQSLTSNVSEIEVSQDKSSKKGILIAAVVAIIALLGGVAWYFLGNQNKYSLEGLAKAAVNYDEISDFHEGLAVVGKGIKHGYIDKMGNEVIPCIYEFMEDSDPDFHDGLALVRQGEKHFFINKEGKEAFPYNYDTGLKFSEGLALVWKDRKCGYIDTKGNEVIALTDKYYGTSFHDGLAAVRNDEGKYGFIDKKGELVIPMSFDVDEGGETSEFHEGYAVVCKNEKYGYIDKSGKEAIPCNYSAAFNFSEGMAVVMKDGKYGFIDVKGKEVIPCEYSYANHFSEGIAVVQKDDKYQFIDKKGKVVLDNSYCGITKFQEGFSVVNKEGEKNEYYTQYVYGIIDKNGKEVIPCIYNTCHLFSEGLAVVKKDGIFGFVDKKGNSTFDIQDEEVKKIVQAKIQEREKARKEKERRAEDAGANEGRFAAEDAGANEGRFAAEDTSSGSPNNDVDYSRILNECQAEITLCQREIESLCRTFGTLASDNNIDMMKYGQMKITFINGVNDWLNKANKAFDKCSRDLQQAGVNNAVSAVNQEKHQFNRAINELKSRTLQQVEMSY